MISLVHTVVTDLVVRPVQQCLGNARCRRGEGENFFAEKQLEREILRGFRAAA